MKTIEELQRLDLTPHSIDVERLFQYESLRDKGHKLASYAEYYRNIGYDRRVSDLHQAELAAERHRNQVLYAEYDNLFPELSGRLEDLDEAERRRLYAQPNVAEAEVALDTAWKAARDLKRRLLAERLLHLINMPSLREQEAAAARRWQEEAKQDRKCVRCGTPTSLLAGGVRMCRQCMDAGEANSG